MQSSRWDEKTNFISSIGSLGCSLEVLCMFAKGASISAQINAAEPAAKLGLQTRTETNGLAKLTRLRLNEMVGQPTAFI